MSTMMPMMIKRFQKLKEMLRNPETNLPQAQVPALTKELEQLEAQFADEELFLERGQYHECDCAGTRTHSFYH